MRRVRQLVEVCVSLQYRQPARHSYKVTIAALSAHLDKEKLVKEVSEAVCTSPFCISHFDFMTEMSEAASQVDDVDTPALARS